MCCIGTAFDVFLALLFGVAVCENANRIEWVRNASSFHPVLHPGAYETVTAEGPAILTELSMPSIWYMPVNSYEPATDGAFIENV